MDFRILQPFVPIVVFETRREAESEWQKFKAMEDMTVGETL